MRHLELRHGHRADYRTREFHRSIGELLKDQQSGKRLTLKEKKRVQEYAEQQRVKNFSQKKKKRRK